MLVNVADVPDVEATAVPVVNLLALVQLVPSLTNTLPADPAADKAVPPSAIVSGVVKSIADVVIPVDPSITVGIIRFLHVV
jgi:hypothetical protein